jgi:hypothetical protein
LEFKFLKPCVLWSGTMETHGMVGDYGIGSPFVQTNGINGHDNNNQVHGRVLACISHQRILIFYRFRWFTEDPDQHENLESEIFTGYRDCLTFRQSGKIMLLVNFMGKKPRIRLEIAELRENPRSEPYRSAILWLKRATWYRILYNLNHWIWYPTFAFCSVLFD